MKEVIMFYTILAAVIVIIALFVIYFAARILCKKGWLLGWFRGMMGLILLFSSTVLALAAIDFYSYKQFNKENVVASLSFRQVLPQLYRVSLVDNDGAKHSFQLAGDLWQLDARILKWKPSLTKVGLAAGFRLDRLSGRYYSLEEERGAQRTVYELSNSKSSLDLWQWLKDHGSSISIIDASYGSATYLPMEDGALFSVSLSNTGLLARPLNERAIQAVKRWQ
jgi:hypothetical protein